MTNEKISGISQKKGAEIGENCEIYKSANFGSEPYLILIGNHVHIGTNAIIMPGVTIKLCEYETYEFRRKKKIFI